MVSRTTALADPPARFRHVLGHFPTGMVAVTAFDGEPVGLAVGSFSSISLDPPMVGFFVDRSSTTWPRIRRAGRFAVNVLGAHQEELCRRFGRKGMDRFAGVRWHPGLGDAPLIEGALAWIECDLDEVLETGDHVLAIGAARRLEVGEEGRPLIFFRGDFTRPVAPPRALEASR
jgi:3-hydroxy-9,10-secoandrosta-1,3,5(10)-triene-9,17-dione monooxygenase reductase component